MQEFRVVADALGSSLKQTCRDKRMDLAKAGSRHVAERVLHHWRCGFGGSPILIRGGLLLPQAMRPTSDGDIVTVRRWSEEQVHRGFFRITHALRVEGIAIEAVEICEIPVGEGDPVLRVGLQAMCGTVRGNTHIDIAHGRGPYAFPKNPPRRELPSMLRNIPCLVAHAQPLSASAAEKWFAVLTRNDGDFRAKHALDLLLYARMGVDPAEIASEMIRIARHRGIPLSVCAPSPRALEWTSFLLRADSWMRTAAERRIANFDAWAVYEQLGLHWRSTHRALTRAVIADVRRRGNNQASLIDRLAARQRENAPVCRPSPPTP